MSVALYCNITIEELAADKCTVKRRITLKDSKLSIVRDDLRQILIRVTPTGESRSNKAILKSIGYPVVTLELYKRFASHGKATISLPVHSVRLILSNCPPDKLGLFLVTLRSKLKALKTPIPRAFIPDAPPTTLSLLEEVSPLRVHTTTGTSANIFNPDLSRIPTPEVNRSPGQLDHVESTAPRMSTPIRKHRMLSPAVMSFSHVVSSGSSKLRNGTKRKDLQRKVIDLVKDGRNVFCTGGAGTGKSHLIRRIIGILPPEFTAVTATTGTAANIIRGMTIHAFSGVGGLLSSNSDDYEPDSEHWLLTLKSRLRSSPSISSRWRKLRHLIIDEISMLSSESFSRLETLARLSRCSSGGDDQEPFGGLQVILFGDFFQLPPISKNGQVKFAFESPCWARCRFECVELVHSWRQSDDPQLARLLRVVREGQCPDWARELLRSRCVTSTVSTGRVGSLTPTRLCTHRKDAEAWNANMLNLLQGQEKVYPAQDNGTTNANLLDAICPAPKVLRLKIGAMVMLLRNIDTGRGLVNGARGVVERLGGNGEPPVVRFFVPKLGSSGDSCGDSILHAVQRERWGLHDASTLGPTSICRRQFPLCLAWAVSIHKSQGITLDTAELALSKVFENGQAYVALSRCRTLSGLRLLDWRPDAIQANPKVVQFYLTIRAKRQTHCSEDEEEQHSPIKRTRLF